MPSGMEVVHASGEVSIVLALSEPNVMFAARKMSILLSQRLDIYCRYPDFSGLVFFDVNPEGIEPSREHREMLERLIASRRTEFGGRTTLSGKPVRFEVGIGGDGRPEGELGRFGLREEFLQAPAPPEPLELNEIRSEESGLDVLVVSFRAETVTAAVKRLSAFCDRDLAVQMQKPNADGWVIFHVTLALDEGSATLSSAVLQRNLRLFEKAERTESGRQVWLSLFEEREPLTPEAVLARALESRQAQRDELEREAHAQAEERERKEAELRRWREQALAETLEEHAQEVMAQQARAQVLERRRQRALLPAALFVVALLVLGFVLGVRSGAFGVVSLPLLRLLAALVAFGAVFRVAWAGTARFVLAGMALGEAVRLVLTLMRPAAERESLLLAGAEVRVLLLVAGAVLVLVALDRSRSVLAEKDARLRQLLGGVLGLFVCLATPRPAVVICREPWRPSFAPQLSQLDCHVIREASVCQRVPGCSVSAVCRAPRGYEDTNKPCGRFSDQQSCAAQTFCQWIACDGVPKQPCAAFTPGECPARMCRLDEY